MIKQLLDEIERKFAADMAMTAGIDKNGLARTVRRGKAIFIRPEQWIRFRRKWERKDAHP